MKTILKIIFIVSIIIQNSICFGQSFLKNPFDGPISNDPKYFELKIEMKGKTLLDKEIKFKYQVKNISNTFRNFLIYDHAGSPIGMDIHLTAKSGIPLKYQSRHFFSESIYRSSIKDCVRLGPGEVFEGEVSIHSALYGDFNPLILTPGEYILKITFNNVISNEIAFQLQAIPEFDTIQNIINKYIPSDWKVSIYGVQSYPEKTIDEIGKFFADIFIQKKKDKINVYEDIDMVCYKSQDPEFDSLIINKRIEPKDCIKKIPSNYNYKIAKIKDKYIFIHYDSQCWGGFSQEQKDIIKNVIDGINKNH